MVAGGRIEPEVRSESTLDRQPEPREAESAGTTASHRMGRSTPVQAQGHVRLGNRGPGGRARGTKARSEAPLRREAPLPGRRASGGRVGGTPWVPGGRWSAQCAARARGICTAHRPRQSEQWKGWANRAVSPNIGADMYMCTQGHKNKMMGHGEIRPSESARGKGRERHGTVEGGRPPTGGPVRSDRKEHRSSRVSRSYGPRSITGKTEWFISLYRHIFL